MKAFLSMLVLLLGAATLPAAEPAVSFRNDVMAVLSRSGCNAGACHGNLNGRGGMRLSLRGDDPNFDLLALTRGMNARRTNPQFPAESLLLKKASGQVAHEGGTRFGTSSKEYAILQQWIADGCRSDASDLAKLTKLTVNGSWHVMIDPQDRVKVAATAEYSDGSIRDVTELAAYDTSNLGVVKVLPSGEVIREQMGESVVTVRYLGKQVPIRLAFLPDRPKPDLSGFSPAHPIDEKVRANFEKLRITPAEVASDSVFLRRVFLDTLGIIPTAQEASDFLANASPEKRAKLIDTLLERPEFATYWAQKWSDLLRNEEKSLDSKGVQLYSRWIKNWIAEDKPLNEFAREIVKGRGSSYDNPAASFYRAVREPYQRAESVAQVFLGLRVGCAKCHNHPFDRWTQDDYHQFAALFNRIEYRVAEFERKDKNDKHEFNGEQFIVALNDGEFPHPRGGIAKPKFLGTKTPDLGGRADRLGALADWIADEKNPFFAVAQANRVWAHLLGEAIVEPIDDFKSSNPATNPELLRHLTEYFRAHEFRLKLLVKHILTSKTYQLASRAPGADEHHFSHAFVQPLEAEQLLDAVAVAVGSSAIKFPGYPSGTRAGEIAATPYAGRKVAETSGMRFLKVFGRPERLLTCECERNEDPGILQAFQMITGDLVQNAIRDPHNRLQKLIDAKRSDQEILNELYLSAIARRPNAMEEKTILAAVVSAKDRRAVWEDVLWGLLNSKEFLLRR
jgi:hypothetical protein